MTQSNDLPSRMSRAEDSILDLRLAVSATLQAIDKNSADIAQLIEVSRRNSEGIAALLEISRRHDERIAGIEGAVQDIRNTNTSINAAIEHMDRLLDYLLRRNPEQPEE
ncbi:MAG: hypothetical protein MUF49_30330 [Oculatellaceae cyanobacterium Prado106]|jgi:DNA-binding FadR family transcriptional regulator|nr:hypothetical protein [Oculatellaceae cyanobacterium Prado106]